MALSTKFETQHSSMIRDVRPFYQRWAEDYLVKSDYAVAIYVIAAFGIFMGWLVHFTDLILLLGLLYFWFLYAHDRSLVFKLPMGSKFKDKNNDGPGRNNKAEGILYLGNAKDEKDEVWFTNSDARTHILYLGTTGSGKTEGLKSIATNAMAWASGFVYVDGKADTDLWSSLSSLVRRFGRDDDLLVLNYMTGNSDVRAPSNTMNPFSSGSASYLTNMLVSLMPNAEGDNAMWKERAVSLVSSLMPVLTWRRDNQDIPMSVGIIRDYLNLDKIIQLSRDKNIPEHLRVSLEGYLDTLPGYIPDAFDDQGREKPMGPNQPPPDTTTCRQQHGYLSMQFTRSLQSLGDDYGYIFDTQAADVDMTDVVLNRRILVVLIPALEKSGDEIANLGKIVAATIKGMMGSTLGATVEGDSASVIENKPTHSSTPFITIFDEVGYYTAEGMAVMAAQARSLGFCLVFSGQDLPAMKKRVKEEANSITANCNIKIFGKLEDPTETKDFFEKTVGSMFVTEMQGFQGADSGKGYYDNKQASVQNRSKASYDELRSYKEGQAIITFGDQVVTCNFFYSNPGKAKAMRVTRFISLPPPDETFIKSASGIATLRDRMVHKSWTAMRADVAIETESEISAMLEGLDKAKETKASAVDSGIVAIANIFAVMDAGGYREYHEKKNASKEVKQENTVQKETPSQASNSVVSGDNSEKPKKPPIFSAMKKGDEQASSNVADKSSTTEKVPESKSDNPAKPAIFGTPKAPPQTVQKSEDNQEQQQQTKPLSWKDIVDNTSKEKPEESESDKQEKQLSKEDAEKLADISRDIGNKIFESEKEQGKKDEQEK